MRGFVLCLLIVGWAIALPAWADTLRGVVIRVIDGDTVWFKPDRHDAASRAFLKIRLVDIDAPEKNQPYGDAATRALTTLVLKQQLEIHTVATDSHGRTLARIQRGALSVNMELVRLGFAWVYDSTRASARSGSESFRAYKSSRSSTRSGSELFGASTRTQRNAALMDKQDEARRAQRGLWADAAPTPPWVWRRAQNASVN